MLTEGKIALICSREINTEVYGNRDRYGGGFHWTRTDTHIRVHNFWKYVSAVPDAVRLHLFGTTPENTIGCIVIESTAPETLKTASVEVLHRIPLDFGYDDVVEYDNNIDVFEDTWKPVEV